MKINQKSFMKKEIQVVEKIKTTILVLVFIATSCGIVVNSTLSYAEEPLRIAYYNNYPPFSYSENNEMKGFFIDVVNEIGHRMDIPIKHLGYPWARAQKNVAQGECDAFITAPTEKRKIYAQFVKESIVTTNIRPFVSASNPKLSEIKKRKKISDWKDYTFVAFIGGGWSQKNLADMNVQFVSKVDQLIMMLDIGRADIHLGHSIVTNHKIKKLGYEEEIIELDVIIDSLDWFLGISKSSPYYKMIPLFQKTIHEMKQDGTIGKIIGND